MNFEMPHRKASIVVLALGSISALLIWRAPDRDSGGPSATPAPAAPRETRTYSSSFRLTENPISEGGNWINGGVAGRDWANVQTAAGLAFGTESGAVRYDDSAAILAGPWGPNQTAQARVYSVNPDDSVYEEVELRLRSSISLHQATGYEVNFRCSKSAKAYAQIVRWNGALGKFTYLATRSGSSLGVRNGDYVKATIEHDLITAFINGTQVLQARDDTYRTGSPGIGFYVQGTTRPVNRDFGFTWFSATDGPAADPPPDGEPTAFLPPCLDWSLSGRTCQS
jgi:hypothetical protein